MKRLFLRDFASSRGKLFRDRSAMRLPFFRPTKRRPCSSQDLETIRSVFSKFQRIQKLNTRALEIMAEMERALGGEYIFDRAFLESSVRELSNLTYQVVYSLNALADNRYIELFDLFQAMKSTLEDILTGGEGPFADHLTLPFSSLGWEMEPLAGALGAFLAEIRNRLGIAAPDGFVVTAAGCRKFFERNRLDEEMRAGRLRLDTVVPDLTWLNFRRSLRR